MPHDLYDITDLNANRLQSSANMLYFDINSEISYTLASCLCLIDQLNRLFKQDENLFYNLHVCVMSIYYVDVESDIHAFYL